MSELFILLVKSNKKCHSERAERVKNPYSDLLGSGLRDASAKFILSLSKGFTSPQHDKLKWSHIWNRNIVCLPF